MNAPEVLSRLAPIGRSVAEDVMGSLSGSVAEMVNWREEPAVTVIAANAAGIGKTGVFIL